MKTLDTDILIVGFGASGFAAALGALEHRQRVLVIDQSDGGGDAIRTNVGTICGTHYRTLGNFPLPIPHTFVQSVLTRLQSISPMSVPVHHQQGLYVIPYDEGILFNLMKDWIGQQGATFLPHHSLHAVATGDRHIGEVITVKDGQYTTIRAQSVVDCTGTGHVAQISQNPLIRDKTYQSPSQVFRITGVSTESEYTLSLAILKALRKQEKEKEILPTVHVIPGSLRNGKADLKVNLPIAVTDETEELQALQVQAMETVHFLFSLLKTEVDSLNHAQLEKIFPQVGIRVRQRPLGKYTLTEDDVLSCRAFDDSIAFGTWPIEEWTLGKPMLQFFPPEKAYTIPLRCLQPPQIDNLFFAGKGISASTRAIASARVMGTVWQTGYAAGKMAAAYPQNHMEKALKDLQENVMHA